MKRRILLVLLLFLFTIGLAYGDGGLPEVMILATGGTIA